MTTQEFKTAIENESGIKVSIKMGTGSMLGYVIATAKNRSNFDYNFSRNFIKQFPECSLKPAFANNYQIMVYHGINSK